jgi:hypothetical protein
MGLRDVVSLQENRLGPGKSHPGMHPLGVELSSADSGEIARRPRQVIHA